MQKVLFLFVLSFSSFAIPVVEYFNSYEHSLAKLPFSEAVRVGRTIYLSGQIGIKPGASTVVEGGIEAETRQLFANIAATLKHFQLDLSDLVKCQVMLADIKEWPKFNGVYTSILSAPFPARSAFASSGLALGARVELECLAVIK